MIIGVVNSCIVKPRVLPAAITLTPFSSGTTTGWTLGSGVALDLDEDGAWRIAGGTEGAKRLVTVEPYWAYTVTATARSNNASLVNLEVSISDSLSGGSTAWTSQYFGDRTTTTQSAFYPTGNIVSNTFLALRFTGVGYMDARISQIVITAYQPA